MAFSVIRWVYSCVRSLSVFCTLDLRLLYARGDQFILDKTTNSRLRGFSILFIAFFLPAFHMQYCCSNKENSLFKTVSDEASIKRGRPKLAASFIWARRVMSPVGTFETCKPLKMSDYRGRLEVMGTESEWHE